MVRVPLQLGDLALQLRMPATQADYYEQDGREAHRAEGIGLAWMAPQRAINLPMAQQKCCCTMRGGILQQRQSRSTCLLGIHPEAVDQGRRLQR